MLEYLMTAWTVREAGTFIDRVDGIVKNIALFPELYRESEQAGIRQAVITPQTLLLYRILEEKVELLTFFDTRRDPADKFSDI